MKQATALQMALLALYAPVLAYGCIVALAWVPILMSAFRGVPFLGPGPNAGRGRT